MSSASSTETSVVTSTECPYRRTLKVTVCALAHDAGFAAADDVSLETLTEMLQSCEFHCRTHVHLMQWVDVLCLYRVWMAIFY